MGKEMESVMASLVIEYKDGQKGKLKMMDSKGIIHEEISLAVLDYMLSSHSSLERYLEVARASNWIQSTDVTLKIVDTTGEEYPLPFSTKYNEIIYKCSESAVYKGKGKYIEKSDDIQAVSNMEFQDFFQDFTSNILDDEGNILLKQGYFASFSEFETLLKEYCALREKEDDMYAASQANRLEKDIFSNRTPRTIDDYLRIYPIFRKSISFIEKCVEKRNTKKEERVKKTKGKKIMQAQMKNPNLKREASYYANKRSLCYLIGNNCEPLILKTMTPFELDHYIMDNYKEPREIRREYRSRIEEYILSHKEYVKEIRSRIQNPNYSGQLTILEHDQDGYFRRLGDNTYLRYPIIYSSTFKSVRNLYCNIDKFRHEAFEMRKNLKALENKIAYEKTKHEYGEIEANFQRVIANLEGEKGLTKEKLENAMTEIKTIMSDMQELEQLDYQESVSNIKHKRVFSKHESNLVRYAKGPIPKPEYKKVLDEWARSLKQSSTDYDNVRFILRHLRKKEEKNYEFPVLDQPDVYRLDQMNKSHILPVSSEEESVVEKEESFLSLEELEQMYGDNIPDDETLRKGNIHVHK